jgi:hypothetical protein
VSKTYRIRKRDSANSSEHLDLVEPLRQTIKEQRAVINDIHKRVVAVSKGLEKSPS